jgi:hypothetical protein
MTRNNELFIDQILTSLKIISMIKEGQKVCVRNGLLSLEPTSNGVQTAMRRWLNNDSRQSTLAYIKNVVNNALDVCNLLTDHETILKISNALNESSLGLGSLSVTYEIDVPIVATIQVMQDRINTNLKNLSSNTSSQMSENVSQHHGKN